MNTESSGNSSGGLWSAQGTAVMKQETPDQMGREQKVGRQSDLAGTPTPEPKPRAETNKNPQSALR